MKETPLSLIGPMVLATLAEEKQRTRRVIAPQPFEDPKWGLTWEPRGKRPHSPSYCQRNVCWNPISKAFEDYYSERGGSPYGAPGDRLRVRESFSILSTQGGRLVTVMYLADKTTAQVELTEEEWAKFAKWKEPFKGKPPMYCFRSLSRIWLEVTSIGVERVQAISDEEAKLEGIVECWEGSWHYTKDTALRLGETPREAFAALWNSINDTPKRKLGWEVNPWVWVVGFKLLKGVRP